MEETCKQSLISSATQTSNKQSLNSSATQNECKDHLYALIICGGAGTRLWPRSRKSTPKQFLGKFFGEKTLFVQTVDRAKLLTSNDKIFVCTIGDYVDEIIQQGPDIPPRNIIAEPFGKNTAMAIGLGSAYIKKVDPKAVIMNFWADALIKENEPFVERLNLASEAAYGGNYLVTVGLKPTFPHTGLGYVEVGEKIGERETFKVISFKEKPDLATATDFVAKGNFFWNSGIYVWSVQSIFEAFQKYSPKIYTFLEDIYNGIGTAAEREIIQKIYDQVESMSIDTAVSEKADNLLLVPANFTWSDVGDWKVTYDLKEKDVLGNVIESFGKNGWHLGVDTTNCLIESENRLIATVGVSDLVIIETEDSVVICSKDKAQDI